MDATARQVGQDILEFYFRGGNPPDLSSGTDQIQKFSNLFGDSQFNVIGTITARKMASLSPSPVYEYVYNHMGTVSTTDIMIEGFGKYIMKVRPNLKCLIKH